MGKTIEEMLADGVHPTEIHRMIEAEVQKKKEREAAARREKEEQRQKDAAEAKRKAMIEESKRAAAEATLMYLCAVGAIDLEMVEEHIPMVMECLDDLADHLIADRKMLDLVKRVFGD